MSVLADDCRGFLDAQGSTRPVVLGGLSMGGYVVFEFYRKYPQRIAGLILAATRAGADSPKAKANRDKTATFRANERTYFDSSYTEARAALNNSDARWEMNPM